MILLLRPLDESLKSAEMLHQKGFVTALLPLSKPYRLGITPDFSKAEALIFTSTRALDGISLPAKPCFVVGEKTKQAALALGAKEVISAENGQLLSAKINASPFKYFYWGAGSTTAFDLINSCPSKTIFKHTLYEMRIEKSLPSPLPANITAVLHYSAETLKKFITLTGDKTKHLPHFCMSTRIAEGLPQEFTTFTPETPTEVALFSLLLDKMPPK